MAKLIVIHGPTGVGKSTMAAKLYDSLEQPLDLVSQDAIYHDLLGGAGDPAKFEAVKLIELLVDQLIQDGYQVILEGLLRADRYRPVFKHMMGDFDIQFIYLSAYPDTTSKRHAKREISELFSEDKVREWHNLSEPYGIGNEIIIQTDEQSEDETRKSIKQHLNL